MATPGEIEERIGTMDALHAAVLSRPLREGWAPAVGLNLYEVADEDWPRHQELVEKLKAAPQTWVDRGARIQLLARWRDDDSPGFQQVIWVNWFPTIEAFLGESATDSERDDLNEWYSIITNRRWYVGEDVTAEVDPEWRPLPLEGAGS